jgi:hypothetical protein
MRSTPRHDLAHIGAMNPTNSVSGIYENNPDPQAANQLFILGHVEGWRVRHIPAIVLRQHQRMHCIQDAEAGVQVPQKMEGDSVRVWRIS